MEKRQFCGWELRGFTGMLAIIQMVFWGWKTGKYAYIAALTLIKAVLSHFDPQIAFQAQDYDITMPLINLTFCVFAFVMAIVLLRGAVDENPWLILSWMMFKGFVYIISIIMLISEAVLNREVYVDKDGRVHYLKISMVLLGVIIPVLIIWGVNEYRKEIIGRYKSLLLTVNPDAVKTGPKTPPAPPGSPKVSNVTEV